MILWSIQPIKVYEQIQKNGRYLVDSRLSDNFKDFKDSYSWLKEQMSIKGIKNKNNNEIIWAWHTYNGKHEMSDMKDIRNMFSGDNEVILEIDIPDEEVVLSDYNTWHFVLNNSWIDDSTCEEEWEKNRSWYESLSFEEREHLKKESWQKVFDVEPFISEWVIKGMYVQASFFELKSENIKQVYHIN